MAAQSLREQEVRDAMERTHRFHDALESMFRPTPLQEWLANVKIPAADEGER